MKTIVLFDTSNGGHKEAFMQLFAKSLLALKCRVICIMPDTLPIRKWIELNNPSNEIYFIDKTIKRTEIKKFGRLNDALTTISYWYKLNRAIGQIEKKLNLKADWVFINWLDNFLANYIMPSLLDLVFTYRWSGLYFHPAVFRIQPDLLQKHISISDIDSALKANNCFALTIHDEGIVEGLKNRIQKPVFLFPEIADITPPSSKHLMYTAILEKAKGRTIIGTIGLEFHKGVMDLVRLCIVADPSQFFFVFAGGYNDTYLNWFESDENKNEFISFKNNLPENVFWQEGLLEEGEDYNSVFCSFDIIYLVYRNFYSSSNRLTKAANFQKLVLASEKYCVGEDVEKYDLGLLTQPNNISHQYAQLIKLKERLLKQDFPYEKWKIYAEKHSTVILSEKFQKLLNLSDYDR